MELKVLVIPDEKKLAQWEKDLERLGIPFSRPEPGALAFDVATSTQELLAFAAWGVRQRAFFILSAGGGLNDEVRIDRKMAADLIRKGGPKTPWMASLYRIAELNDQLAARSAT